jgi:hypothetical protein
LLKSISHCLASLTNYLFYLFNINCCKFLIRSWLPKLKVRGRYAEICLRGYCSIFMMYQTNLMPVGETVLSQQSGIKERIVWRGKTEAWKSLGTIPFSKILLFIL